MATAKAKAPPAMVGGTAIKPVERHGLEAIRYLLHNPDTGEILTRTPMSWLLITIFYLIYYSCLAGFWLICMAIFLQTINYDEPRWQAGEDGGWSRIGTSPGLGLRPKNSEDLIDSAIIMFNTESNSERTKEEMKTNHVASWQEWTKRIDHFLEPYNPKDKDGNIINDTRLACSENTPCTDRHGCKFSVAGLDEFVGKHYGYKSDANGANPVVFLKLNKIFGLKNTPYNINSTKKEDKIPEDMPEDLKEHIRIQTDQDQVWVNCQGRYPADKELLEGAVEYFPETRGFPNYFFPYKRQKDYLSPFVAVKFKVSKRAYGQLVHIECRAWAANIEYNRRDKIGISVFELHVMDDAAKKRYNGEPFPTKKEKEDK